MEPVDVTCSRHTPNLLFDGCPNPHEGIADSGFFCVPCREELTKMFDRRLTEIDAAINERKRMLENSTQQDFVLAQ